MRTGEKVDESKRERAKIPDIITTPGLLISLLSGAVLSLKVSWKDQILTQATRRVGWLV